MTPLELLPNTYRAFFSGFSALTMAQKQLIRPILNGEDVVLQASTGAGKTEAVLAPATEILLRHSNYSTIIYIVPTRALALDMNRRVKSIYKKLGLKSGIRTGDGKHLRDAAPNLLIMTPESLDVLLGSGNQDDKCFLKHVHLMIIDEVHVFIHEVRGHQLSLLRCRLAMQTNTALQTIALSATIDDVEDLKAFFKLDKNAFFYKQTITRKLQPHWVHIENEEQELTLFFDDLYRQAGCKKILVFSNSRKKCEQIYSVLNQEGCFSENVFLHYSNLSTQERKFIEAAFRDRKKAICIATSTLELGIDVGDVDGVVLMGPPPSTMAFLQRIGRGNRREQYINFWGICSGCKAGMQLIRFLALFELAKENQMEKRSCPKGYSVVFQQILSCLYAKKILSKDALHLLFKENRESLTSIFQHMFNNNWLKLSKQPGLHEGGWRFFSSLFKKQIWSNFPPSEVEYDVILEYEKIAVLPLSIVRQLEIGDCIQLTGKVLKILQIEEKKTASEVLVEESNEEPEKELIWAGLSSPIPFEVAQKMGVVLLEAFTPQGLLNRTRRLLEKERKKFENSLEQPNGMRVYQLGNGIYRYETFLGSIANYILYRLLEKQFSATIEGFYVSFDEIGLECNEWICFKSLKIPHTPEQFQQWVSSHLSLLKGAFSWNSWLHWLPEEYQMKEINSSLYDPRVLSYFQRYHLETSWLPLPKHVYDDKNTPPIQALLKGAPWSLDQERDAWGRLTFPELPLDGQKTSFFLSASQVQGYVSQKLCPRWARFQHVGYQINPHSRFDDIDQKSRARKELGIAFKKQVIEALQSEERLYFESVQFTWQLAIQTVVTDNNPLLLAEPKLKVEGSIYGSPDLIYIQHQGSHISLEVRGIKSSKSISYAHKWRIAFYAYLLESLLKETSFLLPVKVSAFGVFIHSSVDLNKRFEITSFMLAPYNAWMPRLIEQWKIDSSRSSALHGFSMESSCTSCRYFSYCYQETLYQDPLDSINRAIVSKNVDSNDFPKNCIHWYFIHYDNERVRWQCWENGEVVSDVCVTLADFSNEEVFRKEAATLLQRAWTQSIHKRKNPHFLVYESNDWHLFQKAFHATQLKSLWAMHDCWTAIQAVLQTHFEWPIHGRITAGQVGACLGIPGSQIEPLSFYHKEPFSEGSFDLYQQIWSWCLSNIKSKRIVSSEGIGPSSNCLIQAYLATHHRETECQMSEILEFQKKTLPERVSLFRAIGPMSFLGCSADKCYQFSIDAKSPVSKFRVGDFVKISPVASNQIQDGFSVVVDAYLPEQEFLLVRSLSQKVSFSKNQLYALDEDATDWNSPKIARVLNLLKNPNFRPDVMQMLLGHVRSFASRSLDWIEQWYQSQAHAAGLNLLQKEALMLPFKEKIGLIEGPPGTGKTHLLVWTLIALIAQAKHRNYPIKILVTAQTHQAIDQILIKVAKTLPVAKVSSVSLWKYGRFDEVQFSKLGIGRMQGSDVLKADSSFILGATGYGVYQLLEDKSFPQLFDWVIFDESSQVLTPYALLSLIFGKGQALFYGDTQQLPPVLKGNYENTSFVPRSILQELISRYSSRNRLRLNETYRMNAEICKFVSTQWYDGELLSVADRKLQLPNYPLFRDDLDDILDPSKSMVVVQLGHLGTKQSSEEEARWIAKAVKRLIEEYFISHEQIGIISPHRLQNNTIVSALKAALPFSLKLPRVDTVERMQGSEFDIVLFSATVSDKDVVHSAFLKDYRRFNVALTRARKKFIFLASAFFFQSFPTKEKELIAQMPFENLVRHVN